MYRGRGFSWAEKSCIALAVIFGLCAGYGAYVLAARLPGSLSGLAALFMFCGTLALGLTAADGMRNDRFQRIRDMWTKAPKRDEISN